MRNVLGGTACSSALRDFHKGKTSDPAVPSMEEDLQLPALLTSDPRWEFETQHSEFQPSAPVDCLSTHLGPDDDELEEDDDFLDPAQAAIFPELQSAIAQILRDGGLAQDVESPDPHSDKMLRVILHQYPPYIVLSFT